MDSVDLTNKKAVLSQRWPRDARYRMSRCGDMAIRNCPRWRPAANLDFDVTGNSAIRSTDPENPTL